MPEKVPYGPRYKYPHMMPADVLLWERFMAAYPNTYSAVSYDVVVGDGADFDVSGADVGQGSQERLYKLKIDVVGYRAGKTDIIELKPLAGNSAVGQVLAYAMHYARLYPDTSIISPVIITDRMLNDIKLFAVTQKVRVIEV